MPRKTNVYPPSAATTAALLAGGCGGNGAAGSAGDAAGRVARTSATASASRGAASGTSCISAEHPLGDGGNRLRPLELSHPATRHRARNQDPDNSAVKVPKAAANASVDGGAVSGSLISQPSAAEPRPAIRAIWSRNSSGSRGQGK
jgi:hypothetical protein